MQFQRNFGESEEQYQSRLLSLQQQAEAKLAQSVAAAASSPHSPNLDCSNLLKPERAIVLLNAVISSGLHVHVDGCAAHAFLYIPPMTDA